MKSLRWEIKKALVVFLRLFYKTEGLDSVFNHPTSQQNKSVMQKHGEVFGIDKKETYPSLGSFASCLLFVRFILIIYMQVEKLHVLSRNKKDWKCPRVAKNEVFVEK